jgi:type I restriction enzyme S subunit
MELMTEQGHRQIEVGLIPEGWELRRFTDMVWFQEGPGLRKWQFTSRGIKVINITNLVKGYLDLDKTNRHISWDEFNKMYQHFEVDENDIVVASSGNSYCKTSVVRKQDLPLVMNTSVIRFKPLDNLNYNLLLILLKSHLFKDQIDLLITGGAQPNFGPVHLPKVFFTLPKSMEEQKAIATALSDVDALIASLEQTITKKKAIKQGAMQQLLTPPHKGGKRLPGFEGEWVEKTLGEISHIKTGSKNNQDNVEDGEYPFYVRSQSVKRINTYSYDEEAILIPGEGGIGTIFHYINGKFEVHQRVYKISSFSERVLGKFIFLKMKHEFYEHAMINSVKATVDSLRLPTFQEFEIYLPSTLDEQKAIAQILSDMDAEITQLETKKEKYQAIKQGMMQELLTGKTRLV